MPLASIGLPVYNGGRFIRNAIESILAQTFTDFELIISDNASTDDTGDICRRYARTDSRVYYTRKNKNLGASRNFNDVFDLSTGKYFKWASNDDICEPDFLEKCVRVLESDSSVALCHPGTRRIDEDGRNIGAYTLKLKSDSPNPVTRFRELLMAKHACFQVFGVFRKKIMERTSLLNNYSGADRVLLAETALHGRIVEVPGYLFLRRSHAEESRLQYPDSNDRVVWFDPSRKGRIVLSQWRLLAEYVNAVKRSPLSQQDKIACYMLIAMWAKRHWRFLGHDIKAASRKAIFNGVGLLYTGKVK